MAYHQSPDRTDTRTLAFFALASAATVAVGSLGLALHGAPFGSWIRNPGAWATGLLLAGVLIGCGRSRGLSKAIIALAVCALVATLFAPPQSGVHRWVDAGPLHINIAGLLLPATLVAMATLSLSPAALIMILAIVGGILAIQPDASQSSAFLFGSGSLLVRRRLQNPVKVIGLLVIVALAGIAWLRPDPLMPIAEVEGIFGLLAGVSVTLVVAAALGLAATCLVPLRRLPFQDDDRGGAAIALATYFALTATLPLVGNYPVPLLGIGMSFPVGYWLGMALLCARQHHSSRPVC